MLAHGLVGEGRTGERRERRREDWRFAAQERNESARSNFLPVEESLDNKPRTPEDKRPTLDDKRNKEAVIDGFWSPTRQSWSPKATVGFSAIRLQRPISRRGIWFGGSLLIIGESRKDALMVQSSCYAITSHPSTNRAHTEPSPPPISSPCVAASINARPGPPPTLRHERGSFALESNAFP